MSIDDKIEHQKICNKHGTKNEHQPYCNVKYCDPASLAREVLELFYLKPQQMDLLYTELARLIIRGPAGTGKTILIILKILFLIKSETEFNILLFAPHPHNIRCKKLLERNNVNVQMVDNYPIQPSFQNCNERKNQSNITVRIVDLKEFMFEYYNKAVNNSTPTFNEHVFVDDLQVVDKMSSDDILKSLQLICNTTHPDIYTWLALDPVQNMYRGLVRDELEKVFQGFTTITLNHVLRNSQPIIDVLSAQYSERSSSADVPMQKGGHTMNGPPVDIYVNSKYDKRSKEVHLKETLIKIFDDWHGVPTAFMYTFDYPNAVEEMYLSVLKELGKEAINIERYIEQGNDLKSSQVVFDSIGNCVSFEMSLISFGTAQESH